MKRFAIMILSVAMAASLCACGCTNKEPAGTTPSKDTAPSTQTDKIPTETVTIPVPETNVPDTGVDNNTMPEPGTGNRGIDRYNFPTPGMQ